MKSKLDISKIEFSQSDIKRKIKIPTKITEELAELIGIITGDGHLVYLDKNYKYIQYHLDISGHLIDDLDYYEKIVEPMFIKLFRIRLRFVRQRINELKIGLDSKAISTFFYKILNLPIGNKTLRTSIPDYIKNAKNNNIKIAFIRGLADTDFSICFKRKYKRLHYYPVIRCHIRSKRLIKQLSESLKKFGFNFCALYDQKEYDPRSDKYIIEHSIDINGVTNVEKWMKLIGFNNPKHITKYQIWKKFGFCPSNTNLEQRKRILNGELNPHSFYRIK